MVTPEELLGLAQGLVETHREVNFRSAASRAYYAAFLHQREAARQRGSLPPGYQPNIHRRVEAALRSVDEDGAIALATLRSLRNAADYDDHIDFSRALALHAIRLARELLGR